MSDSITPQEFHAAEGTEDWRVLAASYAAAYAVFRSGSFAAGVGLADAIGEIADALDHHPDVDLRYATVTVRTWSHDVGGLSRRDVELARRISDAARELDLPADPVAPMELHLAVDVRVGSDVEPFWRAVLGYTESAEVPKWDAAPQLYDAAGRAPGVWFQQMDPPRTERNRIHVDVWVPHDVAEKRVADAVAAGGHLVTDRWAPAWWVVADAEGNEACVCTWQEPAVGWNAWRQARTGGG